MSVTAFFGQRNFSARNFTSASLAAESTGGAVVLIFNSLPNTSPISLRDARGCALRLRLDVEVNYVALSLQIRRQRHRPQDTDQRAAGASEFVSRRERRRALFIRHA